MDITRIVGIKKKKNEMFKNGVTLKKDGWYVHLMNFMWGASWKNFPNLCPLFWGIIGSIIIFPGWCIWMIIAWFFHLGKPMWKTVGSAISTFGSVILLILALLFIITIIGGTINSLIMAIFAGTFYTWKTIALILGLILGGLLAIVIAAFIITYLTEVWDYHKTNKSEIFNMSKSRTRFIGDLVYYPVSNITKGFGFLFNLIHSIYKKCCPLITWE